jgi:hypothetical protein
MDLSLWTLKKGDKMRNLGEVGFVRENGKNGEKWNRQRWSNGGADDWRMGGGDMVVNGMCLGNEMVGI